MRAILADLPVAIASGFIDEALQVQTGGVRARELIFKAEAAEDRARRSRCEWLS